MKTPKRVSGGRFLGRHDHLSPRVSRTAATAAFDAPATSMVSGDFNSPLASSRTPSRDAAQHAGLDQRRAIDRRILLQLAGIERRLQRPEIDDDEALLEIGIVEAALRQAAMQRRLAAFKAVQGNTGASRLALAAARAGLAFAGADASAATLGDVMRAFIVSDLVELHVPSTAESRPVIGPVPLVPNV